jgi:hypothetical protein
MSAQDIDICDKKTKVLHYLMKGEKIPFGKLKIEIAHGIESFERRPLG